jgi:hypothetical protein
MTGVAIVACSWIACAVVVAPLLGRLLRRAREAQDAADMVPDFIPAEVLSSVELSPPAR